MKGKLTLINNDSLLIGRDKATHLQQKSPNDQPDSHCPWSNGNVRTVQTRVALRCADLLAAIATRREARWPSFARSAPRQLTAPSTSCTHSLLCVVLVLSVYYRPEVPEGAVRSQSNPIWRFRWEPIPKSDHWGKNHALLWGEWPLVINRLMFSGLFSLTYWAKQPSKHSKGQVRFGRTMGSIYQFPFTTKFTSSMWNLKCVFLTLVY